MPKSRDLLVVKEFSGKPCFLCQKAEETVSV